MPLGKYYCDYCDKQFQDIPSTRKRHLQGLHHRRAKARWYASISIPTHTTSDPNQGCPDEGLARGVCNRFVRTGFCQYGDSCKYYHPKPQLQTANTPATVGTSFTANTDSSAVTVNLLVGRNSFPGDMARDGMGASQGNLPPSLHPPPEGGYPPLAFLDWG